MRRLNVWLLAFALLWVQLAASAHALEHLHDADEPHHPPCEWCPAYSTVQHGVASQPPMLPVAGRAIQAPPPALPGVVAPFVPHYLSRAPPYRLA